MLTLTDKEEKRLEDINKKIIKYEKKFRKH